MKKDELLCILRSYVEWLENEDIEVLHYDGTTNRSNDVQPTYQEPGELNMRPTGRSFSSIQLEIETLNQKRKEEFDNAIRRSSYAGYVTSNGEGLGYKEADESH